MADLEVPTDQHRNGPPHALQRMVFFSDAVFAIAITLLVIELHAPRLPAGSPDTAYLQAFADLTPSLIGFFISFFVIGGFWAGHHRIFDCAGHWDRKLNLPNLTLLFAIAAMPFFTAFSSNNPGARVPTVFYTGWLVATALANLRLQRVVTLPPVVADGVGADRIRLMRIRGLAVLLGALTALIASWLMPAYAQILLVSMWPWRWVLEKALTHR